jgi:Leucine-rich repeat (LRR) protein
MVKKIILLTVLITNTFYGIAQKDSNLELKIIPKHKNFGLYKELWLNAYLINNSSKPIKMFKVGNTEKAWNAFDANWIGTLNSNPMEFKSFYDGSFSKFSSSSIIVVLPGDSIYAGILRYKIIAGGNYKITYSFKQSPDKVNSKFASSPVALNTARGISSFSVTSKPFEFTINEAEIGNIEANDISDEELKKKPTISKLEQAFSNPSEVYKLSISGNITNDVFLKICNLKNLKELNLYGVKGIDHLPEEIEQLKLRKLRINVSNLRLPEALNNMISLKSLSISGSETTEFPEFVKYLVNLEELYISDFPISELPKEIRYFKELRILEISDTKLKTLGTLISNASKLEELSLSSSFEIFPDISGCTTLNKIDLNFNNKITSIPSFIGNLTQLKKLELAATSITIIPDEIKHLKRLEVLIMDESKLTAIPASLYECTQLKEISISRCQVTTLADGIDKLANLEKLNFYDNQVMQLPVGLSKCMKLKYVNAHTNLIKGNDKEGKKLAKRLGKKYRIKR